LVLLCAGLSVLLFPIGLGVKLDYAWESTTVLTMIMIGFVLLVLFGAWEYYKATKTFIPFSMMKNRSVIAACLMSFTRFLAF
jgi:hypothetical protein